MDNIDKYFKELMTINLVLKSFTKAVAPIPYWDFSHYSQSKNGYDDYTAKLENLADRAMDEIKELESWQIENVEILLSKKNNDLEKIMEYYLEFDSDDFNFDKFKMRILDNFMISYSNISEFPESWFEDNRYLLSGVSKNFYEDFSGCLLAKAKSLQRFEK